MSKAELFANIRYYFKRANIEANNAHRQNKQKELSNKALPSLGFVWLGIGLFFMIFLFGMFKWAKLPTISHVPQQSQSNLSAPFSVLASARGSSTRDSSISDYEKVEVPEVVPLSKPLVIKEQSMLPKSATIKSLSAKAVDIDSRWQVRVHHAEQVQTILSKAAEEKTSELIHDVSLKEASSIDDCVDIGACGGQAAKDVVIEITAD